MSATPPEGIVSPFALLASDAQRRVAQLVADGYRDEEIMARTGRSLPTVRYHIARIARRWALDPSRNVRTQIARVIERGTLHL